MLRECLHILLFLLFPHINTAGKPSELFDMTGRMPGVEKVGSLYFSKLCSTKPVRILEPKMSSGNNIKECLENTTKKCPSVDIKINTVEHFSSNRRELLKRVPVKDRKRREQGWLNGHPNHQDYELIHRYVHLSRKSCFFVTRECMESGLTNTELSSYASNFPHFETRSWGSCAFVGLSDDMLSRKYGDDIDSHDIVIRMGHLPLSKYREFVGSRSDIVLYRLGALKRDQAAHRPKDVKAYLCKNPSRVRDQLIKVTRKTTFKAVKNTGSIYCDKVRGRNDVAFSLLKQLYKNMAPNKMPTSGTSYALRLAFSRLCGRLDIYGISSGGGGTYFEPEAVTKVKHGTELDSWLLHYLMKNHERELQMCIYS